MNNPLKELPTSHKWFLAINVVSAIAIAVLFWTMWANRQQLRQQQQKIIHARYETILRDCFDKNHRRVKAKETIKELLALSHTTPAHRAHAEKFIDSIIEAILPKRNCQEYASKQSSISDAH